MTPIARTASTKRGACLMRDLMKWAPSALVYGAVNCLAIAALL